MAVSFLSHEISDLCIGKPALRALPISATVGEALLTLRHSGDTYVFVWITDRSAASEKKYCAGKICMVDILCYLCADDNISSPAAALKNPVSALLSGNAADLVCQIDRNSRILDALDLILEGADILLVPIRSRKKLQLHHSGSFCWLTPENFGRFFFNSIAAFSPIAALSVTELGLVRSADVLSVRHHEPAISALPLIRLALADQTSVAVVTDEGNLIGEISPSTLTGCDESVAAAIAALSAGDLMAYIDWCPSPPDAAVQTLKSLLKEKGMHGMVELMEEINSQPMFPPSPLLSSSSDEEWETTRSAKRTLSRRPGSYSARMGRKSEEAIVCHPGSSLVAVMVQALAHRVGYLWVVDEEDYSLVGVVVLRDILKVLRNQIDQFQAL